MLWSCLAAAADLAPHAEASLHPILAILQACTLYWPGLQIHCFRCKSGQKVKRLTHSFIYWRWILKKINFKMFWRERRLRSVDISIELAQIFSRLRRVFVLRQRRISASLKLHGVHIWPIQPWIYCGQHICLWFWKTFQNKKSKTV